MSSILQHITLSELQRQVKSTLAERFALPVWVVAEVADLKVNYSGHCYIELIEKGESDGVPKAQAKAVIWRSHYPRIAAYFEAETGQKLGAGMQLLVKATVNYHELYGFSLQISDIDASYTLGDMERRRQQTIARLKAEGIWEMNRELPMAVVAQRIAIISSRKAAGFRDFCNELAQSRYAFHLELFDAFMQGEAAENSMIAALDAVAEKSEAFDVVVVIRGGGSTSDLNCFNAYRLCAHIAQFPLPVLTGIGHDKDVSVADMVAHTALKTPTAVAGWLIERMQQIEGWLDGAAIALHEGSLRLSQSHLLRIERYSQELTAQYNRLIEREKGDIERFEQLLTDESNRLVRREEERLKQIERLVEGYTPARILRLGFSITRHNGVALTSSEELPRGATVEIELARGHLTAIVEQEKSLGQTSTDTKPFE